MTEFTPNKLESIGVVAGRRVENIKFQHAHPENFAPAKIGIPEIDAIIGGIKMPTYVGVGGKAKVGKTIVQTHLVNQLAMSGLTKYEEGVPPIEQKPIRIGVFHLEEVRDQYADRMLTMRSETTTRAMIRDLQLSEKNFEELEDAAKSMEYLHVFIDDSIFDPDEIIRIAIEQDFQIIVVDTFNLLEGKGGSRNESERLSQYSRKFIRARNENNLTTIMVYQLNDDNKALGSRTIYRDCDLILEVEPVIDSVNKEVQDGKMKINILPSRQSAGNFSVDVLCSPSQSKLIPSYTAVFKLNPELETLLDPHE